MGEVKPKGCNGPHTSIMKDGENSMVNCPRCGELQLNFNKDGIVVDGYLDRIVELKAERDAFETEMERLLDEVINSNKFAKDHADKISSLESDLTRHKGMLSLEVANLVHADEKIRELQKFILEQGTKLEKAVEQRNNWIRQAFVGSRESAVFIKNAIAINDEALKQSSGGLDEKQI